MPPSTENFGFKCLSVDNWLRVDSAWAGVVMSSSRPDASEAWVHDIVQSELSTGVPLNVRRLFEGARGALVYSLMFYPLLTLASEQMFRVLEAAVASKCRQIGSPGKVLTFAAKIDFLAERGLISPEALHRWTAIRQLRNEASHPAEQSILPPAEALHIVGIAIELINQLY